MLLREGAALLGALLPRASAALGERGPADGPQADGASPASSPPTAPRSGLQRALAEAGYRVTGWGLGLNRASARTRSTGSSSGSSASAAASQVILVGWSLGGVFAREVAKRRPDLVAR